MPNAHAMSLMTIVPVAPLRAAASHRAEMVSQLLFGELAEILNEEGEFYEVQCQYEGYRGWVQRRQMVDLADKTPGPRSVVRQAMEVQVNFTPTVIPPGAELGDWYADGFVAGPYRVTVPAPAEMDATSFSSKGEEVIHWASQYLGASYMWGGKSLWGLDCSGLTQMAYKIAGYSLPRDAWQQAEGGEAVGFLMEAQAGDLAFFDNDEGRIIHVGILLDGQRIMHASANVRIDPIDHYGIMHADTGERTHKLRMIKRFF